MNGLPVVAVNTRRLIQRDQLYFHVRRLLGLEFDRRIMKNTLKVDSKELFVSGQVPSRGRRGGIAHATREFHWYIGSILPQSKTLISMMQFLDALYFLAQVCIDFCRIRCTNSLSRSYPNDSLICESGIAQNRAAVCLHSSPYPMKSNLPLLEGHECQGLVAPWKLLRLNARRNKTQQRCIVSERTHAKQTLGSLHLGF